MKSKDFENTKWRQRILAVAAAILAAVLGSVASNTFLPSIGVSLFWIPNALAVALLLNRPRSDWRIIAPALFLALTGMEVVYGLGAKAPFLSLVNTTEVLLAAWAAREILGSPPRVSSLRVATGYVSLAAFLPALLCAVPGGWVFSWGGEVPFGPAFRVWFLGDVLAMIVITPGLLHLPELVSGLRQASSRRLVEAAVLFGVIVCACVAVMSGTGGKAGFFTFLYLPVPLFLWAAVRFGPLGASTATLLMALAVMISAKQGFGPFVESGLNAEVEVMQAFLLMLGVTLLLLAALMRERNEALASLKGEREHLEARVRERTRLLSEANEQLRIEAEEHRATERALLESRELLEKAQALARVGGWRMDFVTGEYSWTDESYRLLGYRPGEVAPWRGWVEKHVHPDDLENFARCRRQLEGGAALVEVPFRFWRTDGELRHAVASAEYVRDADGNVLSFEGVFSDVTERVRADEALRASREMLDSFMRNSPSAMFLRDREGRYILVNDHYARIAGRPREEVEGARAADIYPPEVAAGYDAFDQGVMERGSPGVQEQRLTVAGQERIHMTHVFPLPGPVGPKNRGSGNGDMEPTVGGVGGIITDITEIKRVEEDLRESEQRLQVALAGADMGLWSLDLARSVQEMDERLARRYGFEPGEAAGGVELELNHWHERIHPEDVGNVRDGLREHLEGVREKYEVEFRARDNRGRWIWILSRASVVERDSEGRALRVAGTHLDITARREAEEAHRRSEERLELAVKGSSDGIWDRDLVRNVSWWSPRCLELLGYPEIDPGFDTAMELLHPDDRESTRQALRDHLERDTPYDVEVRFLTGSGAYRWFRLRGRSVRDDDGRPVRFSGSVQDIHERKEAEETMRRYMEDIEVLMREVHHRVKNNLQIVSGLLDMTAKRTRSTETREVLADVRARIHAMSLIHTQLFSQSRVKAINMRDFARDLWSALARMDRERSSKISMSLEAEDVYLLLDQAVPAGLILNEALTNVLKHAFPDGRRGRIGLHLRGAGSGMVGIDVFDDGCGMSPGVEEEDSGTLGIRLMTSLARQLCGRFSIDRTGGTRIRVSFPKIGEETQ